MTRPDYPACWPDTQIIRSVHTPFNWRRPGDNPEPLNAGIRATVAPAKRGPKKAGGIAAHAGTMHGLSPRADKLLALKPDHRTFQIGTANAIKTAAHKPKVAPAHPSRPPSRKSAKEVDA